MPDSGRVLILKPTPFDQGLWTGLRQWRFASTTAYHIGDRTVTIRSGSDSVTIDAADIDGVGSDGADILIRVGPLTHRLRFLRDAEGIAEALRTLSEAMRKPAPPPRTEPAMASDRLNDLVGLWQQGLISDAEYEAEKRHFS